MYVETNILNRLAIKKKIQFIQYQGTALLNENNYFKIKLF